MPEDVAAAAEAARALRDTALEAAGDAAAGRSVN
jgi:hypothetical protein